jgi:hypothetical protein
MSSIPSSAMPRAIPAPAETRPSGGRGKVLAKIVTAPAVLALGVMAIGLSKLLRRNAGHKGEPAQTLT